MMADIEREKQVIYDVYDYMGKHDSFDSIKEARKVFKQINEDYGQGSIVKRTLEVITIKSEIVIQSA